MIIVKNNKIIGVDKELLKNLNATLENISSIINTLELEISSLTKNQLTLNNKEFNIKKIDILSIEDLKVFELEPAFAKEQKIEFKTELEEIEIPKTPKLEEIEKFQTAELKIEPQEINEPQPQELNLQEISLQTPEIQLNEPTLQMPEITPEPVEEIKKTLEPLELKTEPEEIEIPKTQKEFIPEPKELEPLKQPVQTSEKISLNQPIELDSQPQLKTPEIKQESAEISISFEDEFSEIEKLMDLSKEEAKEELQKELQTASEELGIDIDTITELKDELFEMLQNDKENLFEAIKNEDYDKIHKIAHKLKGAALNLRLKNLSLILKKIDELSKNKTDLHKIEYFTDKFYKFLDKIQEKEKLKIPKEIKNLILKTIEEYLHSQNEKKFQKDKKYIEKLLNVKINSIEDLQKIIKE